MSLLKYLITEGRLNTMINKIGVSEDLAKEIQSSHSKKFQFVVASIISNDWNDEDDRLPDNPFKTDLQYYQYHKRYFERLEKFTKENNFPNIDFKWLKNIDYVHKVQNLVENLQTIRDYREGATPTPSLTNVPLTDAIAQAEQWHENLKSTGTALDIQDGQDVIKQYDDGYYWLDLNHNNCKVEGGAMGHCGNTYADTLLSLRDDRGEPHITVAFDYDGTYRQAKGKENNKPVEKYHPYMHWLFTNGGKYQIKKYDPEYQSGEDYTISDLPEDLRNEVLDKYPSIDPTYKIRSIINDESLSDKQKFEGLQEVDREHDIFGGELSERSITEGGKLIVDEDLDPYDYKNRANNTQFTWAMEVVRHEKHLDIHGFPTKEYIDLLDTNRYPYESDQIQYLLDLAKDEDIDEYNEKVQEFLEDEQADESLEEYLSDGDALVAFIEFLFESDDFLAFDNALNRVVAWAQESNIHDEITEDLINYILNEPLHNAYGEEYRWDFEYENKYDLVSDGSNSVNATLEFDDFKRILDTNEHLDDYVDLVDYIVPYSFRSDLEVPHYGYPTKTMSRELFNNTFEHAVYE